MERERISTFQMCVIMYPTILATAVLLVPAICGKQADRDLWMSPIWASLVGFATVYIICRLNNSYPGLSLIQYSQAILGKWVGRILGLFYVQFYLYIIGIILREYAEFVVGVYLTRTPIIVVIVGMVVISATAVHGCIEVIARSALVLVPLFALALLIVMLMLIPDLEPRNILPVMEHGMLPSIKGAVAPQGWLSEFALISFLLPFVSDRENGARLSMVTVVLIVLTLMASNLVSLLLFDEVTHSLTFPLMNATRYISIAQFFEHLEAIVMSLWVVGTFVKVTVFYFVLVQGLAQWLKLSDSRPLVLPTGIWMTIVAVWSARNLPELSHLLSATVPFYLTLMQTVIPFLLLIVDRLRHRWQRGETG